MSSEVGAAAKQQSNAVLQCSAPDADLKSREEQSRAESSREQSRAAGLKSREEQSRAVLLCSSRRSPPAATAARPNYFLLLPSFISPGF